LKLSIPVLLVISALWLAGCARNPVTGKRELMLMSTADEIQLGQQSDKEISKTYGLYDDQDLQRYMDEMGQRLAKVSHRPDLSFTFRVLDSPVVNAFAVPGGFVYVTRGILAYLNSEAELAAVLGHEIGHITARHSAKRYSKAQLAVLGLEVGKVISEEFEKYSGLAEAGVSILFLKFSRDDERQADQLGVEYSSLGGYDATHMSRFFITLNRMHKNGGGSLPEWFSTHPDPGDRVNTTRSLAEKWQQENPGIKLSVNRERYLNLVDGTIFGEDPRQGYVGDGVFYHPDLRFMFPVPTEWKLVNTPTQVQIVSPDGNAAILFTLGEGSDPYTAATEFVSKTGVVVSSEENVGVGGLPAYRVRSTANTEQNSIGILSYFIAKDNRIYVFHGFSAAESFSDHEKTFAGTMSQFKRLTDPKFINVEPTRIKIVKVKSRRTLRSTLRNLGVSDDKLEEVALVNGMGLDETLETGQKIKVLDKR
jgi:predicted Zn-dependent protease